MYIPLELIKPIVEQLASSGSRRELQSCSLVCKAWTPTVYGVMFYRFGIHGHWHAKFNRFIWVDVCTTFPQYVSHLIIWGALTTGLQDTLPLLKNIQALRLQISNCADFIRDDSSCARTLASARSILAGTTSPWKHPIILDSDVPALRCITLFFPEKTSFRGQEWRALDVMLARRAPALDCLHNNTEDRRN